MIKSIIANTLIGIFLIRHLSFFLLLFFVLYLLVFFILLFHPQFFACATAGMPEVLGEKFANTCTVVGKINFAISLFLTVIVFFVISKKNKKTRVPKNKHEY